MISPNFIRENSPSTGMSPDVGAVTDNRLVVGGLVFLFLMGLGVTAVTFLQGTFLTDTDCSWEHVPHPPGQEAHFESVDGFVSEFSSANDLSEQELMDNFEFREENNRIEYRSCPIGE